jgi:hypothetical protein
MDTGALIGIVLALFFGGLGLAYGGFSLETHNHLLAVFSYVVGGGFVAAAIVLTFVFFVPFKTQPIVAIPQAQQTAVTTGNPTEQTSQLPTMLRLQFGGSNTIPIGIDQTNIWRWYALSTTVQGFDPKKKTFVEVAKNWTVFLVFDVPIVFKQILVDANGARLPNCEVKDSSNRSAVVVFGGDLTGTVVNIHALL